MLDVADGATNFRPHNNRADNLFPVLLYIVPRSVQPDKRGTHTHTHVQHTQISYLRSGHWHYVIFGFKLPLTYILCQLKQTNQKQGFSRDKKKYVHQFLKCITQVTKSILKSILLQQTY